MKNLVKIKNFLSTIARHGLDFSKSRDTGPLANRDIAAIENQVSGSVLDVRCPYCSSENFVKRGIRQKKREKVQLYLCKNCLRTFTPSWVKGKQHPWKIILNAMSYYNLGFSLAQTCQIMKEKHNENIQPSTLASWMNQHKSLCVYSRMRPFAIKEFSPYEVIETATLAHRQLYRYRYHRAKMKYILQDDFKHYKFHPLQEFLELVPGECPHQYFQEGMRMSEASRSRNCPKLPAGHSGDSDSTSGNLGIGALKFSKKEMIVRAKENYATRLAQLVFQGVKENKQRHEELQKFMLANDSVTVATEVPVYIKKEDLEHMKTQLGFNIFSQKKGEEMREMENEELPRLITGHIDFLQVRNGLVHILDYKAKAAHERPIEQLTLYALALSRLTGLRVFHFKCAWFDEKDYFEFFPLHAVYKMRRRGRRGRKIFTKEGTYNLNERIDKIENLRPSVPLPKLPVR